MTEKVCVKCSIELRCKENSVAAITVNDHGQDLELWDADLWECPECGWQGVLGFGSVPLSEHFRADFASTVAKYPTKIRFWLNRREKAAAQALVDEKAHA